MKKSLPVLLDGFKNPTEEHYRQADSLLKIVDIKSKEQLRIWNFLAPHLALKNWLSPLHALQLADVCWTWVEMERLKKFLKKEGYTYTTETRDGEQIKNRPEVGQLNELTRRFNSYAGSFGLNPAAEKQLNEFQTDLFKTIGGDSENPYDTIDTMENYANYRTNLLN